MTRRVYFFLIVLALLGYVLFLLARATDRPQFCASCHIMEPYVANWQSSTHNTVPCYECHARPGFRGYLGAKLRMLSEALHYWAGIYMVQLHSRIDDRNCLACHPEDEFLQREIRFLERRIRFRHDVHLDARRVGLKLSCQTCHAQLVQGRHTAVTEETCILCHYMGREAQDPVGGCGICHGPPPERLLIWGSYFEHRAYVDGGVPCRTCHVHVTEGRGDVDARRCSVCHVARTEALGEARRIHQVHVARQKIRCTRCHTEIRHARFEVNPALLLQCQDCHGNRHNFQEQMYTGTGAVGVPVTPDPMFLAGVTCEGCHEIEVETTVLGPAFHLPRARLRRCNFCHGPGYDRLGQTWKTSVLDRWPVLDRRIRLLLRVPERMAAGVDRDLLRRNAELIRRDGTMGIHNIRYTHLVLERLEETLAPALRRMLGPYYQPLRHPDLEQLYIENSRCLDCHFGIEHLVTAVAQSEFPHGIHLTRYRCTQCHSAGLPGSGRHGRTRVRDCGSCHHRETTQTCESCHAVQVATYRGTWPDAEPDFMADAGVECGDCHLAESDRPVRSVAAVCAECHEASYSQDFARDQARIRARLRSLTEAVKTLERHLYRNTRTPTSVLVQYERLRAVLALLERDGSLGAHNLVYYQARLAEIEAFVRTWTSSGQARQGTLPDHTGAVGPSR